jgi:hypothetical protein
MISPASLHMTACLADELELPELVHAVLRQLPQAGAKPEPEEESPSLAAKEEEPKKERTPRLDQAGLLRRTESPGRVRVREEWRQAAGAGVREGRGRGESDCGAPGPAPGRCEAGPGARAPSGRVVLRLEPPQPREPGPCRAPAGSAARAGVYPKGLRGFSTAWRTARAAPVSGPPRPLRSSPPPLHRPSILLMLMLPPDRWCWRSTRTRRCSSPAAQGGSRDAMAMRFWMAVFSPCPWGGAACPLASVRFFSPWPWSCSSKGAPRALRARA